MAEILLCGLPDDCVAERTSLGEAAGEGDPMTAYDVVQQQAEDPGLWFVAQYASEAYLQAELRRLHSWVEREYQRQSLPSDGAPGRTSE